MKSIFSRINAWLHLWLGLISGLIVVIVSITGCILVFEEDIYKIVQPFRLSPPVEQAVMLPPSALIKSAREALPGIELRSLTYHEAGESAEVTFHSDSTLWIDPYTAQVKGISDHDDFFHLMESGHTTLWLPVAIGRQFVIYGTLVFGILVITGMVLWWPKKWNRHNIRNAFRVNWKAKLKRVNYDLHNVFGFYTLIPVLFIIFSGLFMGLGWVMKSSYWVASGGKSVPTYFVPSSDTTQVANTPLMKVLDQVWKFSVEELADHKSPALILGVPDEKDESVYVYTNTESAHYQIHYFDQFTGKQLKGTGMDVDKFSEANGGDKLRRINYSLHVGSLWGIPSKIIYFLASLIAASLPVTGLIIWWGKKKKQSKPTIRTSKAMA
ncbi:PepSY domain-containing protein [Chitinophaga sp. sic0106]|uniref:PepSY-associated TM helix domain-containing protein n=1 Tax=Chitinophaga sp. sic0106 TaxID=2854785 RepID=UPI001C47E538|nr:PepSY-associated TM helix domain-containing protein [Chitinophaga sp. sic0106]MBV7529854.1 PepSY domain-containing protein [Chitinophaga sp. sic0106]